MFDFFKKKKVNIWKVFADEMNGTFIPAKHDQCSKTEIVYDEWKIVFDNFTNYGDNGSAVLFFTRVLVKYESLDDFRFEIYKGGFIRSLEKIFGTQDVEIGRPDFDKKFIVKSNNEFKVKTLLQNAEIRSLIESLKQVNIETSDCHGIWEQKLPEKVFELSYFSKGEIKTTEELKVLLKLFKLLLGQLVENKSIQPFVIEQQSLLIK